MVLSQGSIWTPLVFLLHPLSSPTKYPPPPVMRVCVDMHTWHVYTLSTSHISLFSVHTYAYATRLPGTPFSQLAVLPSDSTQLSSPWSLSGLSPAKFLLHPSGCTLTALPCSFASGHLPRSDILLYVCLLVFDLSPWEWKLQEGRNLALLTTMSKKPGWVVDTQWALIRCLLNE